MGYWKNKKIKKLKKYNIQKKVERKIKNLLESKIKLCTFSVAIFAIVIGDVLTVH